jgi:hypothetical protein
MLTAAAASDVRAATLSGCAPLDLRDLHAFAFPRLELPFMLKGSCTALSAGPSPKCVTWL